MSLFGPRRWSRGSASPHAWPEPEGQPPASRDTLAAIGELSRLVRDNPDLVEIYLALGNLYRAQGEIERAVHIRTSLMVRPGLEARVKARTLFELGRDYRRGGFLDRAVKALEEAAALGGEDEAILRELSELAALGGDYERAARCFGRLHNPVAQAHYTVLLARKHFEAKDAGQGRKLLGKALKVHPGSVEAWLLSLTQAVSQGQTKKVPGLLGEALAAVPPDLRFLLLDGVLEDLILGSEASGGAQERAPLCTTLLPVLDQGFQDVLVVHYGALMLLVCGDPDLARAWLERALLLNPEFWPARLELLALDMERQELSPSLQHQLEFFTLQARRVKRFVCRACGLTRERTFFVCPRCRSWHSIAFRLALHE